MPLKKEDDSKNPVLKEIDGIKIRKDNWVKIRLNAHEYSRLVKQSIISTLPVAKIIALSSQPCPICGNDHIRLTIPLGQLSIKKQLTGKPTKKIR